MIKNKCKYCKFRKMAFQDYLTGLANRVLFQDRLNQAIMQSLRYKRRFSLFMLDLDKFKPINDNFGHAVGDSILQKIARRLKNNLRKGDTVARFGGDEFAIIMHETCNINIAINRLIDLVTKPIQINNYIHKIGVSIGYALYPVDARDVKRLLEIADNRMYKAKRRNAFKRKLL